MSAIPYPADCGQELSLVREYHSRVINPYSRKQFPGIIEDQAALLWLLRSRHARSFFEVGTWYGFTTLLVWLYGGIQRARTIDLCKGYAGSGSDYHGEMKPADYGCYFRRLTPVDFVVGDSQTYSAPDRFDVVYIDGAHDYPHVRGDHELARRLGARLIVFHDYRNGNPGVDKYLDETSNLEPVFRVNGTNIAFMEGKAA